MVNEWTRDDLPPIQGLLDSWSGHGGFRALAVHVRDAVVDHLNANGGVPVSRGDAALADHLGRQAVAIDELQLDLEAAERERDEWKSRAEAAEARTAVTRDEVEQAIRGKVWAANREPNKAGFHRVHVDWATDAIHALVAGDDPAVLVVRESDLPEVVTTFDGDIKAGDYTWTDPGDLRASDLREKRDEHAAQVAAYEAVARAIEAGQAADPLLDKAQEFAALADWELTDREAELLHTVAAHVLGREVK